MARKFLEDIAIADVAFEASAKSLGRLFEEAAKATFESMVDLKTVKPKITKKIELKADNIERLLYNFLSELIFIKDSETILFSKFKVRIDEKNKSLSAELIGDTIDYKKQELRSDVKAVTMHMFELKKTKEGWYARVVLDI